MRLHLLALLIVLASCQSVTEQKQLNLDQSVFYDIYVPQWGEKDNFKEIEQKISHLRAMQVQYVILSPLQSISERLKIGQLGSPWAIGDYRSINDAFGTEAALRSLIKTLHDNGIKVLMDWFPAVCTYDSPLYPFAVDSPAVVDALKNRHNFSFNDVALLETKDNGVQDEVIGHMHYWLDSYGLDGFRIHQLDHLPKDFIRTLMEYPGVTLIAGEDSEGNHGLPYTNYDLYDAIVASCLSDTINSEIRRILLATYEEAQGQPVNFTSNIFTQTQRGTDYAVFGFHYKMAAAMAMVSHGHTLILGGQELPLRQNLSMYQHRPFLWPEKTMADTYRELILLKGRNRALQMQSGCVVREIPTHNPKVLCVERIHGTHKFIGIFNFSKEREVIKFDENIFNVNDYKMNRPISIRANEEFKVASMQFLLFSNV